MFGFWAASAGGGGGGGTRTVTATPNSLFGTRQGGGTVQTEQFATVTTNGLVAPITYAWTYVSGDSAVLPTSPTANLTRFSGFTVLGATLSAVYKCVATDSVGAVDSNDITIYLTSLSNGDGGTVVVP